MIIWQGLGFLVAVIIFGCSLIANLISNATVGKGYYDQHKWPFAVSLVSVTRSTFLTEQLQRRIHKCRSHSATTFMMRIELAADGGFFPRPPGQLPGFDGWSCSAGA